MHTELSLMYLHQKQALKFSVNTTRIVKMWDIQNHRSNFKYYFQTKL